MEFSETQLYGTLLNSPGETGDFIGPRIRRKYYAVPLLDGPRDKIRGIADTEYGLSSMMRIIDVLDNNFKEAKENGWIGRDRFIADKLYDLIQIGLHDSHAMRMWRNVLGSGVQSIDLDDHLVQVALEGMAEPHELMDVFIRYPAIETIELAKISHPLKFSTSKEMDDVVYNLVDSPDYEIADEPPVYKRLQQQGSIYPIEDLTIPACVVDRKVCVARRLTEHGTIKIVNRRRLLVRGDEQAIGDDEYLPRKIKQHNRLVELGQKIDESLPHAGDANADFCWLQPISSSYYAFYETLNPKS